MKYTIVAHYNDDLVTFGDFNKEELKQCLSYLVERIDMYPVITVLTYDEV